MAQSSILGRVSELIRANINAILDSAEDPEKMLDQLVRDFTNNIAEAEEAVAQTIGNLRLIEDDAREAREAAAEWLNKARAASRRADELRAAEAESRALYAAALAIGGDLDLDARLERVLDAAIELAEARQARVALVDPDSGEIEFVATRGEGDARGTRRDRRLVDDKDVPARALPAPAQVLSQMPGRAQTVNAGTDDHKLDVRWKSHRDASILVRDAPRIARTPAGDGRDPTSAGTDSTNPSGIAP